MNPTEYRDETARLAKTDQPKAIETAEKISDPWYQAQAWAYVARYADSPLIYALKAAESATVTKDNYQRSAVRAWEIVALSERSCHDQARQSLYEAVHLAVTIIEEPSRAEALFLLFQAAFRISKQDAEQVAEIFRNSNLSQHWRSERALKRITAMLEGHDWPREFFW
jgi:hypothetical protein